MAAQKEATKEDPTPPVAQKVSTPPIAQREDITSRVARIEAENIKEVKRRLKAVEPKKPMCLSSPYDKPFPEDLEQVFTNTEISVFAYPDTYTCGTPIGDKIACDVDGDSLYFIRKGELSAKMSLLGEGQLTVIFGGPQFYKCRKQRKSN